MADPGSGADAGQAAAPLPGALAGRPRAARLLVLLAVFICAACGLVYELALVALGSYLLGDTVTQAAIVLSVMVFAMGVGSLATKRLRRAAASFALVEALLALVGGLSVLLLYAAFAWFNLYQPALIVIAFAIGALIGAEIPLLMMLIQRIRRQDAASAVADLFAADYIGALIGGLAFPFLLLPMLGLLHGALVVGAVNAVVGVAVVLWLFRGDLGRRSTVLLSAALAVVLAVLGGAYVLADRFEVTARQALYRDPIVHAGRSAYQEIVLTRSLDGRDTRLFLNGDLQFSSIDEYRYHEALVHPAMNGPHGEVLVLGGGDGLGTREILRYPDVERVTLVDLDPAVVELAREDPVLSALNGGAFGDPRVEAVAADAFNWLRDNPDRYDVVVADLPDPDNVGTAKLFSVEFYELIRHALRPDGRLVVQAGSPFFAADAYWSVGAGLNAAGYQAVPYQVDVPSFGNWGFFLAGTGGPPELALAAERPRLRFLDEATLAAAAVFPADRRRTGALPSTLLRPRIIDYYESGWDGY
ncbi:spermidine synthase [Allonocardiopsis opalescens]|uniref:Polyamine aminopropyltransferase n=1 Tax=Allonocardiopsis opalescens TaxID=1144618 RepID=A0A2T0QAJ1_9ACTN|nr:spermidine synthase [Allonocardiopsis opalescens]